MKLSKKNVKVIGWAGTTLLIITYTLNIFGLIESTGTSYAVMNIFAAIFLGLRVYIDKNWSNLFLEFFWIAVAVVSLVRYFFF